MNLQRAMPYIVPMIFVLAVVGVTSARVSGYQPGYSHPATVVSRQLRFADLDDGAILVTDAATGLSVARVAEGGDGFLRATMRGLANARKLRGDGPEVPFVLSQHGDGALILLDPVTGRSLDLGAFGPTNEAAFARFLPTPAKTAAL